MTLHEAIDHAREVAKGCGVCATEHEQLADWLEELLEFKHVGDTPTDVKPVVFCKECKFWQDQEYGVVEIPICERFMSKHTGMKDEYFFGAGPDDFCSFAVKKSM